MEARGRHSRILDGLVGLLLALSLGAVPTAAAESLSIGVLKFGTVNWQLAAMREGKFDETEDIKIELVQLASKNATSIALQAGEVDLIVSDWVWAMRQRAAGDPLLFVPYSTALGAVMLAPGRDFDGIEDFKGRRIGVAGGPLDKSWLVFRAWSMESAGFDIAREAEIVYAAPPLLAEQLRVGDLDAALIYWPYAARLRAAGFGRWAGVTDLLRDLGADGPVSLVGYVFREELANNQTESLIRFFKAIDRTNLDMAGGDAMWRAIRPLMKVSTDAEYEALRAEYRSGIPLRNREDVAAAERLHGVLRDLGGEELLGQALTFDPSLFWNPQSSD